MESFFEFTTLLWRLTFGGVPMRVTPLVGTPAFRHAPGLRVDPASPLCPPMLTLTTTDLFLYRFLEAPCE